MTEFLNWLGWGVSDFYGKPLGLCVAFILAVTATSRVFRPRSRDHWADTVYFSLMALVNMMAFAAGVDERVPHYAIKSMLVLLAVRAVWRTWEDWKGGELK